MWPINQNDIFNGFFYFSVEGFEKIEKGFDLVSK